MIYICVLNYNNVDDTIACLQSLMRLRQVEYHILLIDNASEPECVEQLADYAKGNAKITFLPQMKNRGYAGGNNVAIKYAMEQGDCDFIWILNNDTLVEPDSLYYLVQYMQIHRDVGLCGSKIIYDWDRTQLQGYGGFYNHWIGGVSNCLEVEDIQRIDYVIGASVFIRKEFIEQVGLMCEDYFLYFEELDWAERAKGKFTLGCEPHSVVYHKEGASMGGHAFRPSQRSLLADYFGIRNRLLFTRKFYPMCLPLIYMTMIVAIWHRIWRRQYSRVPMILKLMLGKHDKRFEPMDKC